MPMTARDALMVFKTEDTREGATLVADDESALKILATWRLCPTAGVLPDGEAPEDEARRWDWLWSEMDLDLEMLASRSGIYPISYLLQKLMVLQTSRLIYPDGTISDIASKLLAAGVASGLGIRQKK